MADEKAISLDKLARALNKLRDTGLPLNDWQANKKYKVGYTVIQSGKLYRCIIAHISTSTFDTAKWEELSSGGEISNGMEIIPLWEGSFSFNNSTQGATPTSSTPMIELNDYISNFEYIYVVTELGDGSDSYAVTVPVSLADRIRIGVVATNNYFSTGVLIKYDDTHYYILYNNTLNWTAANVVKICGIRKVKPIVSSGMKYETLWEGEAGSLNDIGNTTINLSNPVTGYKKLGLSLASQSASGYHRSYYQELDTNIFMDLINNGSNGDSIQCGFSGNTSYYFEIGKDSNVSQLSISYGHNIITKVTGISEGVVIPTGVQATRVTLFEGSVGNFTGLASSAQINLLDEFTSYDIIGFYIYANCGGAKRYLYREITKEQLLSLQNSDNDNNTVSFLWGYSNTDDYCDILRNSTSRQLICNINKQIVTKVVGIKYINENQYSTEEQLVGTWIDGKPLYQKTYSFNATIDGNEHSTIQSPSGYDKIIEITGTVYYAPSATGYVPVNAQFDSAYTMFVDVWNGYLRYKGTGWTGTWPMYVTIKYTKTT